MSTIGKWFVSRIYRRILRDFDYLRRSPRVKVVGLPAVSFQPVPTEAPGPGPARARAGRCRYLVAIEF